MEVVCHRKISYLENIDIEYFDGLLWLENKSLKMVEGWLGIAFVSYIFTKMKHTRCDMKKKMS